MITDRQIIKAELWSDWLIEPNASTAFQRGKRFAVQ